MAKLHSSFGHYFHSILVGSHRPGTVSSSMRIPTAIMPIMNACRLSMNKSFTAYDESNGGNDQKVPSGVQPSHKSTLPNWFKWMCGPLLFFFLPVWKKRKDSLLKIEGEVEKARETVENVADAVEKVAVVAEKESAKVADKLPENGTLQNTALLVERVSKEAIKEAHVTKDVIHKVDELKQEIIKKVIERVTEKPKAKEK